MAKKTQPLVVSYLRFSTPDQAKGDSVRRQIEASEKWAAGKGWTIDDRLRDAGVSAFRGANRDTGTLGKILKHIDNGTIPKGSFLVIENFDRLSRAGLLEAIELLLSIVRKGVTLVTLSDGREYSPDNFDLTNLIISASQMSRANDESKRKSELVGAAWRRKKEQDAREGKAITAKLPAWLAMDGTKIVPVPERVKVVKEIFKLALQGRGRNWITKHLNQKYGTGFNEEKFWSDTYVLQILRNRAVIGEYQPHKLVYVEGKKKRQPEGEPIADYFPAVIDTQTFYAVQQAITQRQRTGGPAQTKQKDGTTTENVINIWQGILYDMEGFRLISKSQKKWRRYYISAGRDGRGNGEKYIAFPANQFDYCLMSRLCDLLIEESKTNDDGADELAAIEGQIAGIDAKLAELQEAIATKPLATLLKAIDRLEGEKAELERQRDEKRAQRAKAASVGAVEVFERMDGQLDQLLHGTLAPAERLALREALRSRIERVDAMFGKGEDCSRDYLASTKVMFRDGGEIHFAFKMESIDYRQEGYNVSNPYRFRFLVNDD